MICVRVEVARSIKNVAVSSWFIKLNVKMMDNKIVYVIKCRQFYAI